MPGRGKKKKSHCLETENVDTPRPRRSQRVLSRELFGDLSDASWSDLDENESESITDHEDENEQTVIHIENTGDSEDDGSPSETLHTQAKNAEDLEKGGSPPESQDYLDGSQDPYHLTCAQREKHDTRHIINKQRETYDEQSQSQSESQDLNDSEFFETNQDNPDA